LLHLVGVLSSRFAHDARSQEHKADITYVRSVKKVLKLTIKVLEDMNHNSRVVRPSQVALLQTITNMHGSHSRYKDAVLR